MQETSHQNVPIDSPSESNLQVIDHHPKVRRRYSGSSLFEQQEPTASEQHLQLHDGSSTAELAASGDNLADGLEYTHYGQLWKDAREELLQENEDVFQKLQAAMKRIAREENSDERALPPEFTLDDFNKTVSRTKALLHEKRWKVGKNSQVRTTITRFLGILSNLTAFGGVVANINPALGTPIMAGVCVCVQVRNL